MSPAMLRACSASALLALAAFGPSADASAFRGGGLAATLGQRKAEELKTIMMDELLSALGGSRVAEQRLGKIEDALRPMFAALPKNEFGHLDHTTVRYALHRLFVQRHAMYIKGLEPGGDAWNSSSAAEVLEDRVPAYVQSLFEERLHGRGLGMHEMAALAATLEHLIHSEVVERLETSYQVHGFPLEARLTEVQTAEVVETYMVLFVMGKNSSVTLEELMEERNSIESVYPRWPESQVFAREVRQEVVRSHPGDPAFAANHFAFNGTERVVEEIGERYGRWQDSECKDLKSTLMKMEVPGTGRVLLRDFYSDAMGGAWQFTESVDYLRELGALDESDPKRLSVIIPNYVNAPSNCLASSSMFSVCCINECEALLGEVERQVAAPDAEPAQLLDVISRMASATVPARKDMPATLRNRLEEVASHHGGRVPLHGRLFAQFLHHAFPRECPYPHKAGTKKPMTADEWMAERGYESLVVSDDELKQHAEAQAALSQESQESHRSHEARARVPADLTDLDLMWTSEEELVAPWAAPKRRPGSALARFAALLLAGGSLAFGLVASARSAIAALGANDKKEAVLPMTMKSHNC